MGFVIEGGKKNGRTRLAEWRRRVVGGLRGDKVTGQIWCM